MAKKSPPSAGLIAFAILIGAPFFALICLVGVIGILLFVSAAFTFGDGVGFTSMIVVVYFGIYALVRVCMLPRKRTRR